MSVTPRPRGGYLSPTEVDREHTVRTVDCPVCGRGQWQRCDYGLTKVGTPKYSPAHAGRYRAAAALGLVPKLVGD